MPFTWELKVRLGLPANSGATRGWHKFFLATILGLMTCHLDASNAFTQEAGPAREIVATVGNTEPITRAELDDAVGARVQQTFGSQDEPRARAQVLKELIKERLAEEIVTDEEIARAPDLARALSDARRQVLLQYYLSRNVSVAPPSLDEVKAYISEHPDFFERRRTYHFSEIIISLPRESGTSALIGKIQDATNVDEPTPESLRMLCDQLDGMGVVYGYSKVWQSSEQIEAQLFNILRELDRARRKVKLEKSGAEYRVVVLHGSFADPLDPFRSRNGVAQTIMRKAWAEDADAILTAEMAKANISLYGEPLPGLDMPRRALPAEADEAARLVPRIVLAGTAAAIAAGFVALLYFLLEPKPEMMSYDRHFMLRRLWWSLPLRLVIGLFLASLIAAPVPTLLARGFTPEMIVPTAAGGLLAAILILLFWYVPALRGVREMRWLAPTILGVAQAALVVALSLTRA